MKNKKFHSYIIKGNNFDSVLRYLEKEFPEYKPIERNPDFLIVKQDNIGINDIKKIIDKSKNVPVYNDYRIILLHVDNITTEAQNTLLKIVEESSSNIFIFSIKNEKSIIPTLRSRIIMSINVDDNLCSEKSNTLELAKKMLKNNIGERLKIAQKITEDLQKEKITKTEIKDIISFLEKELLDLYKSNRDIRNLIILSNVRKNIEQNGASYKQTLEYIALGLRLPSSMNMI